MLLGMRASAVICAIIICGCGSNADRVPTWHRDVRPIVTQSCTGCHSTGSIAPFPFESYADLFGRQQLIREQVTSRRMPPWPPAPGCTEYADDRSLSEKDRTTLLTWLDHGAPEGNPADATPVSSPPPGGLSRVDRDLRVAAPYTPVQVPDEYRCFLLDWPESARRYVTGFVAKPGNAAIVHHVLVFVAPPGQVSQFQALDDADPLPGYTCFGGPGGVVPTLGGWVPGSRGGDFPAGTGVPIDPGSKIILQVHYNRPRDGASDQTSLQLKLDDAVQRQAFVLPWADPS